MQLTAAALLIAAGAYFNLRMSETRQEKLQVSELTLKNLEAMASELEEGLEASGGYESVTIHKDDNGMGFVATWSDCYGVGHIECPGGYLSRY